MDKKSIEISTILISYFDMILENEKIDNRIEKEGKKAVLLIMCLNDLLKLME